MGLHKIINAMKKLLLIIVCLSLLGCSKSDYSTKPSNQKASLSVSGKWHLIKSETYEISSINDETLIREVIFDSIVKINEPLLYNVSFNSPDSLVLYNVYTRDILKLKDVWYYRR